MNHLESMQNRLEIYKAKQEAKQKREEEKQRQKEKIVSEQRKKQYKKIARLFHTCGEISEKLADD